MAAKKAGAQQMEFPELVFAPLAAPWRKFLIATPIEGGVMYEVWAVPVSQTRDHKFYQCRLEGGAQDGQIVTAPASLLNHLPYERVTDGG